MAAGSTYQAIATTTFTGSALSYSFSSIPSTYTDLVLVISAQVGSAASNAQMTFNGDSATNYSTTFLDGDGTSVTSSRSSSVAFATVGYIPATGNYDMALIHIQNYSNSTTYKTCLVRISAPTRGLSSALVNLWRSTAAITSLTLQAYGGGAYRTFAAGTTFTLYGIKAA